VLERFPDARIVATPGVVAYMDAQYGPGWFGDRVALIFRARVGDRDPQGLDFVHTNTDGLIDELTVMVRPMSGLVALGGAMGAKAAGGLKG
jgi:hypothetical protein